MRKAKYFFAMGLMLTSTVALAHRSLDPIAGMFGNLVAGNGGLAWFILYGGGFSFL